MKPSSHCKFKNKLDKTHIIPHIDQQKVPKMSLQKYIMRKREEKKNKELATMAGTVFVAVAAD